MTLRLSDDETEALRTYAEANGVSMQEAARQAVRLLTHEARVAELSRILIDRDRELLDRLAQ